MLLTKLCEKTRQEAFDLMLEHAAELGTNPALGARAHATELIEGVYRGAGIRDRGFRRGRGRSSLTSRQQ